MRRSAANPHLQALAEHTEWEWHFNQLAEFIHSHGHADLGTHPVTDWLHRQRHSAHLKKLSPQRQQRLRDLGIDLCQNYMLPVEEPGDDAPTRKPSRANAETWERSFIELEAYQQRFGHCEVPKAWPENPALAKWVHEQRALNYRKRLLLDRFRRLDALGFAWTVENTSLIALWETRYAELRAYHAEHGHTNVTKGQNRVLGHWRDVQREFRRKGMLKSDRVARLDAVGFEWEAPGRKNQSRAAWNQHLWEVQFTRLRCFKKRFKHCHVPVEWDEDRSLGAWVAAQRQQARTGRLNAKRRYRLEVLGFQWKIPAQLHRPPFKTRPAPPQQLLDLWETRYAELCAYQAEHGHTNVTRRQNPVLETWRGVQRYNHRKGKLSPDRIARLDAIGFEWEASGRKGRRHKNYLRIGWEERFTRLAAFKDRFGHTQVPERWSEDKSLADWVGSQRKYNRSGKLPADRRQRLDALGFVWKPSPRFNLPPFPAEHAPDQKKIELWETRNAELCAWQAEHGHTNVTKSQNRILGHWRDVQREFRRKGMLKPDRIARLDAIGFEWETPSYRKR